MCMDEHSISRWVTVCICPHRVGQGWRNEGVVFPHPRRLLFCTCMCMMLQFASYPYPVWLMGPHFVLFTWSTVVLTCGFYAMASVPNLIAELGHIHDWVHTQISCGLDPTAVAAHQFESLLAKVGTLGHVSTDDATLLVTAIRDHSLEQWTPRDVAQLCSAVGGKTGLLAEQGSKKQWQEISVFSTVLTATEVAQMQGGDLSEKACIRIVTNRAKLIGMHTLSETSKGRIAAVVAHATGGGQTADAWYDILTKVKKQLSAAITARKWAAMGHRTIWNYDTIDHHSAESWWQAAYPTEGPCMQDIKADEHEFVRGSSNRLKKKTTVEAPAARPAVQPDMMGQLPMFQAMFGGPLAATLFANAASLHNAVGPAGAHAGVPARPPMTSGQCPLEPPPKAKPPREEPPPEMPTPPVAAKPDPSADGVDFSDEETKLRKLLATKAKAAAAKKRPAAADGEAEADHDGHDEAEAESSTKPRPSAGKGKGKGKVTKTMKSTGVAKRPAAKPSVLPTPPREGSVHYRAGYVLVKQYLYRAVVARADKRLFWGPDHTLTRKEAWDAALRFIDERS